MSVLCGHWLAHAPVRPRSRRTTISGTVPTRGTSGFATNEAWKVRLLLGTPLLSLAERALRLRSAALLFDSARERRGIGEWLSLRGSYPRDHWFKSSSRNGDNARRDAALIRPAAVVRVHVSPFRDRLTVGCQALVLKMRVRIALSDRFLYRRSDSRWVTPFGTEALGWFDSSIADLTGREQQAKPAVLQTAVARSVTGAQYRCA